MMTVKYLQKMQLCSLGWNSHRSLNREIKKQQIMFCVGVFFVIFAFHHKKLAVKEVFVPPVESLEDLNFNLSSFMKVFIATE